jgi:RNA polymerase sigma factor for flagellar operon FliA
MHFLSQKERLVIHSTITEDLTIAEIEEILGCTESRVSQIHSQVIKKIRERIKKYVSMQEVEIGAYLTLHFKAALKISM